MESKAAIVALAALAQESRLKVFRLLVAAGGQGASAGEIASGVGIPAATLSFHLKELAHAGLVESRREGRSIRYSLCVEGMRGLLTFLTKDCCQGQPELCDLSTPAPCCTPSATKRKPPSRTGAKR